MAPGHKITKMLTEEEIATRARQIVADTLGVDEKTVTPECRFIEDLGADSLDLVELTMDLEEEFGGDVEDEEAEKVLTLQDAIELIKKKKKGNK
jgi:acyl carrier protein